MASLGYEKIEGQDHGHWLLIIARPREESYFFAPTLKALQKQGDTVSVLCLSACRCKESPETCSDVLLVSDRSDHVGPDARGCPCLTQALHRMHCAVSDESLKKSRQQELRDACGVLGVGLAIVMLLWACLGLFGPEAVPPVCQ